MIGGRSLYVLPALPPGRRAAGDRHGRPAPRGLQGDPGAAGAAAARAAAGDRRRSGRGRPPARGRPRRPTTSSTSSAGLRTGGSRRPRRRPAALAALASRARTATASRRSREMETAGLGLPDGPRGRVARRLGLPARLRGDLDLHRPLRLAGAADEPAAPPAHRAAGPRRARPLPARTRAARSPGCWSATRTSTTPSTHRRSSGRFGCPAYGSDSLRAADGAARLEDTRGRGRALPRLRARAVRGQLRPQPPLEAAARDGGPVLGRPDLRAPRRALAERLQVRPGLGHPHRRRGDHALPPGQRRPDRRRRPPPRASTSSWRASPGRSFTERYWERILPKLDPEVVVPTHYDDFFEPLGRAARR